MKRTAVQIRSILSKTAGTYVSFYLGDDNYWCPTKETVERQLSATWIDKYKYIPQAFDCDKFSTLLSAWMVQERMKAITRKQVPPNEYFAWAFGEAWITTPNHAINVTVLDSGEVLFIEPQTDGKFNYVPRNGLYFVKF